MRIRTQMTRIGDCVQIWKNHNSNPQEEKNDESF